ncbi:MAG: hypothetical protein L6R38_008701 [Xanthoria sp. 2 TBL-2021]|nr:MAG: hypothetical protein L6R38_008701 [Xanthoria sp. 2 TBL-2021]
MLPASIYSFSLAAFVALTFSSAIPASSPRTPASISPLDVNQAANGFTVLPFASTWSLPSAAPNASFEETEQEFRQLKDFKPPKCDAALYGRALQVESCRDAQKMIPTDRRPLLFGIRNRGRWNVNLPYRWKSPISADGLCVIEIGTPAFGVSDQATGFEIAHAAWAIINTCVADYKHEGGRSDGVGLLKRLTVHVASYDPHVRCAPPRSPPAPQAYDCNVIIDQMATSMDLKDFAPEGTPHLDFVVPYELTSRTSRDSFRRDAA